MITKTPAASILITVLFSVAGCGGSGQTPTKDQAVRVVYVPPASVLARAGVRSGDELTGWMAATSDAMSRGAFRPIRGFLEWQWLRLEYESVGVRLSGRREGEPYETVVEVGPWKGTVVPILPRELERARKAGGAALGRGERRSAIQAWSTGRDLAHRAGNEDACFWFTTTIADVHAADEAWATASELFGVELAQPPWFGAVLRRARAAELLVEAYQHQLRHHESGERAYLVEARDHLVSAVHLLRDHVADGLALADMEVRLGKVYWLLRDHAASWQHASTAESVARSKSSTAPSRGTALLYMGGLSLVGGDLRAAQKYFADSCSVRKNWDPSDLLSIADCLNGQGRVARRLGRFDSALDFHERALSLRQAARPFGPEAAESITTLALLADAQGDLQRAEELLRRAIAQRRFNEGDTTKVANWLEFLGSIAWRQERIPEAKRLLWEALDIARETSPGTPPVARILSTLGELHLKQGEIDLASRYIHEAVGIRRASADGAPNRGLVRAAEVQLGDLAHASGDLEVARDHYRRVRDMDAQEPMTVEHTDNLSALARVAYELGDTTSAIEFYEQAVATRTRNFPLARGLGQIQAELAVVRWEAGDQIIAERLLGQALEVMERDISRTTSDEFAKGRVRSQYSGTYHLAVESSVVLGNWEEGFERLERYRAQGFLAMLAARDLRLGSDASRALDQARRRDAAESDEIQRRLRSAKGDRRDALSRRLRELRKRALQIEVEAWEKDPMLAAVQYPRSISADEAATVLDPNTVLLSYSVGPRATYLFVVRSRKRLIVHRIGIDQRTLQNRVEAFIRLTAALPATGSVGQGRRHRRDLLSGLLHTFLIAPAAPYLRTADRVLIVPDGPLHRLPFGALRSAAGEKGEYLSAQMAVFFAPSVTAYNEILLAKARRARIYRPSQVVLFGDPVPSTDLARLEFSRREAQRLGELFAGRATIFLGLEASETEILEQATRAQILHVGAHARLNDSFPLDSHLVLAPSRGSERDDSDGLLTLENIYEHLRLDTDLVTLAACESAAGSDGGGEGILGLSRGFLHAGALAVVGTLWPVLDAEPSHDLIVRFYEHLASGKPAAQALRLAQTELQASDRWSDPYYWAAFQLYGDASVGFDRDRERLADPRFD